METKSCTSRRDFFLFSDVEEELEVVWQAATRENQQIKESLWHSGPTGDILQRAFADHITPRASIELPQRTGL